MKRILFILLFISALFSQTRTVNAHLLVKGNLLLEGSVDDAHEGIFTVPTLTADRTYTSPDTYVNLGSMMIDPMTTRGDIIYRNSSNVIASIMYLYCR